MALRDRLVVPRALVDELLQGLLGVLDGQLGRQSDPPGQRLDALAFALPDPPGEVDAGPAAGAVESEGVAEVRGVVIQASEDRGGEFGGVGLAHTSEYEQDPGGVRNG